MCGISGIFDRRGRLGPRALMRCTEAMGAVLRHRGPDDGRIWTDTEAHVGLAHRRLAVISSIDEGRQPVTSRCGRFVLTYNGEIYNFRALMRDMGRVGHLVDTRSDAVALVEAIAYWGVRGALDRCVGMFAFAVFDRDQRVLCLARDRLGVKPLYWGRQDEHFLFGSELKAIIAAGLIHLEPSPSALANFLRYAYVPTPATIYRNVYKLPPGAILTIKAMGEPKETRYWDIAAVAYDGQRNVLDPQDPDVAAETERLVQQAISDQLTSDVPLGAWLSGGVDSSCIVALAQAGRQTKMQTFSAQIPSLGYDEAPAARRVAAHLGTNHHEFRVTPDEAMMTIDSLPEYYDEPFADASQIPTSILSCLTRRYVTVALAGDGGDEVFGGYNRYIVLPWIEGRLARWSHFARAGFASFLFWMSPDVWDRLAHIAPFQTLPQVGSKLWKVARVLRSHNVDEAYQLTVSQWSEPDTILRRGVKGSMLVPLDVRLDVPVARLQLADMQTYLPDGILTKIDRASMAHALEVRVPFLDHRLVEHVWRFPRSALLSSINTKKPLRQILKRFGLQNLVTPSKSGFAIPIGAWLRGPLRDWAEDLLSEATLAQSELLEPKPIRSAWSAYLAGRSSHLAYPLWTILMYQLWSRRFVAGSSNSVQPQRLGCAGGQK